MNCSIPNVTYYQSHSRCTPPYFLCPVIRCVLGTNHASPFTEFFLPHCSSPFFHIRSLPLLNCRIVFIRRLVTSPSFKAGPFSLDPIRLHCLSTPCQYGFSCFLPFLTRPFPMLISPYSTPLVSRHFLTHWSHPDMRRVMCTLLVSPILVLGCFVLVIFFGVHT